MSSRKTTLEQWRMLQAVVDHGGYTQAAEVLHRSHSSLNHAVAKLQSQLGVSLLEVKGRKAELTEAGRVLLRRSRQLSADAEALEQLAESLTLGWEPEIVLSVEQAYPQERLRSALRDFYRLSRGGRIRIAENVLGGSLDAVTHDRVDIAIIAPMLAGHIGEPLCEVNFWPVAAASHPLFSQPQPITQQELTQELQIVVADTSRTEKQDFGWLKAEQRWTVDSFHSAMDILKCGLGFSWLPEHLIQEGLTEGHLKTIQVKDGSHHRSLMRLLLPKGEQSGPGSRKLAALILQYGRTAENGSP